MKKATYQKRLQLILTIVLSILCSPTMGQMIENNDIFFSKVLEQFPNHTVTIKARGNSMRPFIFNDNKIILEYCELYRVGDIVLAHLTEPKERYVLHRIIDIDGDKVTLMGDANLVTESCIKDSLKALCRYKATSDGIIDLKSDEYMTKTKLWEFYLPQRTEILSRSHSLDWEHLFQQYLSTHKDTKLLFNHNMLYEEMEDGESMIIKRNHGNMDFSEICTINDAAALVHDQLTHKEFTVNDAAKVLTSSYEVDDVTAYEDCELLIAKWLNAGIVLFKPENDDNTKRPFTDDFFFSYINSDTLTCYSHGVMTRLIGQDLNKKLDDIPAINSSCKSSGTKNGTKFQKETIWFGQLLDKERDKINRAGRQFLLYDSKASSFLNLLRFVKQHGFKNDRLRIIPYLQYISCMRYWDKKPQMHMLQYKNQACLSEKSDSLPLVEILASIQTDLDRKLALEKFAADKANIMTETIDDESELTNQCMMAVAFYNAMLENPSKYPYLLLASTPFEIYIGNDNEELLLVEKNTTFPFEKPNSFEKETMHETLNIIQKNKNGTYLRFSDSSSSPEKNIIPFNIPKGLSPKEIYIRTDANPSFILKMTRDNNQTPETINFFDIL